VRHLRIATGGLQQGASTVLGRMVGRIKAVIKRAGTSQDCAVTDIHISMWVDAIMVRVFQSMLVDFVIADADSQRM